jgi:hypothetical protein
VRMGGDATFSRRRGGFPARSTPASPGPSRMSIMLYTPMGWVKRRG